MVFSHLQKNLQFKEKNIEKVCLFKKINYLWHEIKFIYSQTEMVCEKLAWAGVGANGN